MRPHILVLEDDATLGEMLQTFLTVKGYEVSLAHTCLSADEVLRAKKVDLLFADKTLDGEDGAAYCKQLKADPAHAHLTILLTSGYTGLEEESAAWGADGFIPKPYDMLHLMAKIREMIG